MVKCQVATHCKTRQDLVHGLVEFGWELKPLTEESDKELNYEMLSRLVEAISTPSEKNLVLVFGDLRVRGRSNKIADYRESISKFLGQHWFVEIHGWLHALDNEFLELQTQYPGRVTVFPLDGLTHQTRHVNNNDFRWAGNSYERCVGSSTAVAPLPCQTVGVSRAPRFDRWLLLRQPSPPLPPSPPQSAVISLQQQLAQMQVAFAELQTSFLTQQQLQQEQQEMEQTIREQANAFEEERALAAQRESDARLARRLQLEDREESLTCSITCELYEDPVTTVCCGKTFSAEVIERVGELCPWCRNPNFVTHPNRDIAELVEQFRAEMNAIGLDDGDIED